MNQYNQQFITFRQTNEYKQLLERPIAYFCAEFAFEDESPTYAGGLGVLAGDTVKEAADQEIPFVAVGLYYHEGYLHHELYSEGTVLKFPMRRSPEELGFKKVVNEENHPISVTVPLHGRQVKIEAWEKQRGKTVKLILLDTNTPDNTNEDKEITNRLYIVDKETRFKQEMVLGIGGLRMLEALKVHPSIYHLNEGHSALLALEIAHHEMHEYNTGFLEEIERAKQHMVFTNHTLIAAGNDMFSTDMVAALLTDYAREVQVPLTDILSFGQIHDSSIFSMTTLALRMSSHTNAVSRLHAEKAKEIWKNHPMLSVTNGIHLRTWDKMELKMKNEKLKIETISQSEGLTANPKAFWQKHQENKKELLELIQRKTSQTWSENDLLIGWARRIVAYKRPLSLFQNQDALLRLLNDEKRPLRVVMAGSAHESDIEGAKMLEELQRMIVTKFDKYVVYLPNYSLKEAKILTAGCDVWLNTPVVGFEACGTSGMKACLNGCLPLTTKDGWVHEVNLYQIGWEVNNESITDSLLNTLEHQIIPMYYFKDKDGIPGAWIENMKNARNMILNDYSTTRMLWQYFDSMYLPTLSTLQKH